MCYVTLGLRDLVWDRSSGPAAWGAAAGAVGITVVDANDVPAVTVTGAAGLAIRWHAVVQGSEVVY